MKERGIENEMERERERKIDREGDTYNLDGEASTDHPIGEGLG